MVHTQNVNVPLPNCFAWSSVPTDLAHISLQGRMNKSVDQRDQHGLGKPAQLVKKKPFFIKAVVLLHYWKEKIQINSTKKDVPYVKD